MWTRVKFIRRKLRRGWWIHDRRIGDDVEDDVVDDVGYADDVDE